MSSRSGLLSQLRLSKDDRAKPDRPIPAEVIEIVPAADRSRGTVPVRVALLERDSHVLPDMAVRVACANERATEPKGETNHD